MASVKVKLLSLRTTLRFSIYLEPFHTLMLTLRVMLNCETVEPTVIVTFMGCMMLMLRFESV